MDIGMEDIERWMLELLNWDGPVEKRALNVQMDGFFHESNGNNCLIMIFVVIIIIVISINIIIAITPRSRVFGGTDW